MAKYSQKVMGKEIGNAEVYAEPHTMTGKKIEGGLSKPIDANTLSGKEVTVRTPAMRVSVGFAENNVTKTTGMVTRGNGCAIKGRTARGPMA